MTWHCPPTECPLLGVLPHMNKAVRKNIAIIAVVSILAVALFSRFAPASLQNLLTGAKLA